MEVSRGQRVLKAMTLRHASKRPDAATAGPRVPNL